MTEPLRALRRHLKQQRAALPPGLQHLAARQAVAHLARTRLFRAARHIALYLPVRGELDPTALRALAHPQQRFYLPILASVTQGLSFIEWTPATRMRKNRFHILEPLAGTGRRLTPNQLDLVVCPLLGFDSHGTRLGMGGGFYDRSFARKRRDHTRHAPWLIGFAYAFQHCDTLPLRTWDVALDAVCTPAGFAYFPNKR